MEKLNFLIIGKDYQLSRWLRNQLEDMGHAVADPALTSEDGMLKAERLRPDLTLIDMQLDTQLDGIDTARKLWEQHRIPVIYMVSALDQEILSRARCAHPLGYLNKPVRSEDLLTTMEIALNHTFNASAPGTELQVKEESLAWSFEEENTESFDGESSGQKHFLITALDQLSIGVILINADLRIQFANFMGRRILQRGDLLYQRTGQLSSAHPGFAAQVQQMFRKGGCLMMERDNGVPLQVRVCSTMLEDARADIGRSHAILYLFDCNLNPLEIEPLLQEAYKLSPAEARVAASLMENPDLAGVANRLFISPSTVRTHLKRIFMKTQTHSQSSLIHLIITGPAGGLLQLRGMGNGRYHLF